MSSSTSITSFPLGAYLGDPDNSSASAESSFEAEYSSFVSTMGAAPTYLDNYVDYTQPISEWISNASWQAASDAQSADASSMTPVIGLPMASTASDAASADAQYQAIAAGTYDSVYQGIVQAYAAQGYTNLVLRPGWEMNIEGSTYAGDTAQDQADWVTAYQRIYTVLHQEATSLGVNVTVVWNPGTTNYANANALTSLYPGNAYVDAIGADVYSGIYPYSDGTNSSGQATYHDWDNGQEDTSTAQFIADPVNREHYWTYPASTEWSNDGSGGHALSLDQIIAFAEQQGKPLAIPETGAGNSNAGTDVSDDAAFPQWLSQQLTAAQAQGEKIDFVNLWDSNGGGNYEFSNASDGKPQEAAAWAQYFGAQASTALNTTTTSTLTMSTDMAMTAPAAITLGSGHDAIVLNLAEDPYQGDAQYTVFVDSTQVGGIQTETASDAAGQSQQVTLKGNWGDGTHTVSVDFLNDNYGGTTSTDRNLYVTGASYDGTTDASDTRALMSNGTQSLTVGTAPPGITVIGSGFDTLALGVAEDYYQGDAQFTVSVDGVQVGGTQTAVASDSAGQSQTFNVEGNFGTGQHTVAVDFLNDDFAGASVSDRNLYVTSASYDGNPTSGTLTLDSSGSQSLQVVSATTYSPGSAGGSVTTTGDDTVDIGSGAVTVNATGPSVNVVGGTGGLTFIGSSGSDTVSAGSGAVTINGNADTLTFIAGTGPATVVAGTGQEVFELLNGQAGGSLTISDFTAGSDTINLQGYTGTGIQSEQVFGGSTSIMLTDNTKITLVGVTNLNSQAITF